MKQVISKKTSLEVVKFDVSAFTDPDRETPSTNRTTNHNFSETAWPTPTFMNKITAYLFLKINFFPLQLSAEVWLKLALYQPSKAALWLLMAACWTGPPPPPGRSSSTADTRWAPLGDTPDGSLSAPAGSNRWVLRSVRAASAGSCFPDSEYAASYTGTALEAKSQSEVERIRSRMMTSVSHQLTERLVDELFNF